MHFGPQSVPGDSGCCRNFVYNWPSNGAFSHRGRISRPRARRHPRRHSRRTVRSTSKPSPRICGAARADMAAAAAWRSSRIARRSCPACGAEKRSAARSRCRSRTATGPTGSTRCASTPEAPRRCRRRAARAGDASASRARGPRRRREVRARGRARHPRARQRARNRRPRCGRRRRPAAARRAGMRITSHVFSIGERGRPDGASGSRFEQAAALPRRSPLRCVDRGASSGG